jgi:hypothetical protein
MAEGLVYRFKEETDRGTPIEVTAPKSLVDDVTSRYGALHRDTRERKGRRVHGRHYDGQGNVTLDFDLNTNGIPYFEGEAHLRSIVTLEVLADLDMAAQRRGLEDSRVNFILSPPRRSYLEDFTTSDLADDFFRVSFEDPNPDGDPVETAQKIQAGMKRAADLWLMYNTRDHGLLVDARYDFSAPGYELRMGPFRADGVVLSADPTVEPTPGRINLFDPNRKSAEERLAALVGIISALNPPQES